MRERKKKENRRRQILAAAQSVFSDKGFSGATMEDIARKAELSPGTLYLYFKNKEDLYASLCLRILAYMLVRLEGLAEETEPLAKLRALKRILVDVYEFDGSALIDMFHLQSSETLRNISPELRAHIERRSRRALGEMARLFQEGISQGVFIDRHPVALAGHHLGAVFRRCPVGIEQKGTG